MTRTYTDATGTPVAWHDSKRYLWILGLVIPTTPLVGLALFNTTGWGIWLWITPITFLGIIPILDLFTGYDDSNPPEEIIAHPDARRLYLGESFRM